MPQHTQDAPQKASAEAGRVQIHELSFARSRASGRFRAMCSCGWCRVGMDEQQIRSLAAGHDVDWVPA